MIEIIVVLIMMGVLSTITIRSIFIWIERAHVAEALPFLKSLVDQVDLCVMKEGVSKSNIKKCIDKFSDQEINTAHFIAKPGFKSFNTDYGYGLYLWRVIPKAPFASGMIIDCGTAGKGGFPKISPQGLIGICSWSQDGTNTDSNAGHRKIIGRGIYQGMYE